MHVDVSHAYPWIPPIRFDCLRLRSKFVFSSFLFAFTLFSFYFIPFHFISFRYVPSKKEQKKKIGHAPHLVRAKVSKPSKFALSFVLRTNSDYIKRWYARTLTRTTKTQEYKHTHAHAHTRRLCILLGANNRNS